MDDECHRYDMIMIRSKMLLITSKLREKIVKLGNKYEGII
jgi:hypothetical protein